MHRRQTHRDDEATKAAIFRSRYSYVSTRIHPGTEHQCRYLAGVDCEVAYLDCMDRAKGRCEECGAWRKLEVHHKSHKTKMERCWCQANLMALCVQCHRGPQGRHVQVQWRKKAADEFKAPYEKTTE